MDKLLDRVTSGRIFKQVTNFAYGRTGLNDQEPCDSRDASIFEDAEDCSLSGVPSTEDHQLTGSEVSENNNIADGEQSPQIHNVNSMEEDAADGRNGRLGTRHIPVVNYQATSCPPPVNARYAEVFTFVDKDSEVGTGLSLTKVMVWQFNAVYHGEQRITEYMSRINSTAERLRQVVGEATDINDQLQELPEDFQDDIELVQAVLRLQQELMDLTQLKENLDSDVQYMENAVDNIQKDIQQAKNQLFVDMKDSLDAGCLLEPFVEELQVQDPIVLDEAILDAPQQSPTPSEVGLYTLEVARQTAVEEVTEKIIQVQDSQRRFDDLPNIYNKEYDAYIADIELGLVNASKSEFDAVMLLDSRDATAKLIQAEEQLEQARIHAMELGLTLDAFDQESCFQDCADDGYRESLENLWIAHVDRRRIERWMNQEDDTPESADFDEWDSKTVDISDSVSAIADTFKSRKRIDRWRAMCEAVDVEVEMNVD